MNPGLRCRATPLLIALLFSAASPGRASCSREIIVPAASSGHSITVQGAEVGGMIPELLAQIGAKAGCTFRWSAVPRMRLEAMFEAGSADLLVPATQVARRDLQGVFVPVVETRPTLISVTSERAPVASIAALLERRDLRVALVRGYDYGPEYRALIASLAAQGRLYLEPDARNVARLIAGAMADVTIMPPSSFIGSLQGDARTEGLAGKLRIEPLDELPWIKSGIYLSRKSLSTADRELLEQALAASVKSGVWWQALRRYYTPAVLHLNIRPLSQDR